jgi:glucokinase
MARSATVTETWLVGDIGGTNARFGLISPERKLLYSEVLADSDYAGIGEAIEAFLKGRGELRAPRQGAIAIASPITGDLVSMTNHPWRFSLAELRRRLGFDRLEVINDFTAQALALPYLGDGDKARVGGGNAVAGRPLAVLGPGSGLGVSGLIPCAGKWVPLTGEGGHATMSASDERESAVLAHMRGQFDHVSAERCISGPGLVNIYNALAAIDGARAAQYAAAQITDAETGATDPRCHEATQMFCAMLGAVAGNLALTLGAQGGVFIAGGIVPRLGSRFAASPFRERFEAKGRFQTYLAAIPTAVVTHPLAAFVGCGAALTD